MKTLLSRISIILLALCFWMGGAGFKLPEDSLNGKETGASHPISREVEVFNPLDEKIYVDAKIDEDFCDNSIIVVLKKSASVKSSFLEYKDQGIFNDIEVESIRDLTAFPEGFVTTEGNINKKIAPALAEHFEKTSFRQILCIKLDKNSKQNVLDVIKQVEKINDVMYVGPNRIVTGAITPNDPKYIDGTQWGLNKISASGAWGVTTGESNVRVGVIDSGIALHDDLNANMATGWDFYNNNATTTDDIGGHGTSVAGVIGAVGNNGIGITGVAQNITLVPLQTAYDTSGPGHHYEEHLIKAITYAKNLWGTSQQISILNYSISGFGSSVGLLSEIEQFPGLFVWSAGNTGTNVDLLPYAGQFKLPNLISVGATMDANDSPTYIDCLGFPFCWGNHSLCSRVQFNYGATMVDLFAPGHNIYTTSAGNGYRSVSGTSFAAPHVTGVAALILARHPKYSATTIKQSLMNGVDKVSALSNLCVSGGRLNAHKALGYLPHELINNQGSYATVSGNFFGTEYTDVAMFIEVNGRTQLHLWQNGRFYSGIHWSASGYSLYFSERIVSGDFNGDGFADIAALHANPNSEATLSVWYGSASGFLYNSNALHIEGFNAGSVTSRMAAGDFNGDGFADIAMVYNYGNSRTRIFICQGSSNGFTLTDAWYSTSFDSTLCSNRITAGDFNGDGKDDLSLLYWRQGNAGSLYLWNGTSSGLAYQGQAASLTDFNTNNVTGRMVSGDFNGDEKDDIAMCYNYGSRIAIFMYHGTSSGLSWQGAVIAQNPFDATGFPGRLVAGDFTGNGYCDILAFQDYINIANAHQWNSSSSGLSYYGIVW